MAKILGILSIVVAGFSLSAHADVVTCNIKNVGSAPTIGKTCQLTLDTKDFSAPGGPGSIDHHINMGSVKNTCGGMIPANFALYDQGTRSATDLSDVVAYLLPLIEQYGSTGIDPKAAKSLKLYQGGEGAVLVSLYEFFDSSGTSLGVVMAPYGNPVNYLQGCYVK